MLPANLNRAPAPFDPPHLGAVDVLVYLAGLAATVATLSPLARIIL